MKLYNTLSHTPELLTPLPGTPLRLFVCGPTVYDAPHLGHARTYLIFDAVVRYLRSTGVDVQYLQNITDIDDRIIVRAHELGVSPKALALKFERLYHQNEKRLGITEVTTYARATDFIPQIVDQVLRLREKGHAYEIAGDGIYFDITTFSRYGALAKRTVSQADDSFSRIDESIHKRNKGDFVLWKFSKAEFPRRLTQISRRKAGQTHADATRYRMKLVEGEPAWDTPLGWGRPGWHIEDTAITEHIFGPHYDLHGGAIDLIFPHHEAEIAQQESLSGKAPLARFWMHTGFLLADGKKMSKSLKNFITIDSFLAHHSPSVLRMMVFSHHYRSPIDYTDALVTQAAHTFEGLYEFFTKLQFITNLNPAQKGIHAITPILTACETAFYGALEDDFNTPKALSAIFEAITRFHGILWELSADDTRAAHEFFAKHLRLLGLAPVIPTIPRSIHTLLTAREKSRASAQFIKADDLRKKIEGLGYKVEDTPFGPFVRKAAR